MKTNLTAFLAGVVFALGLGLSGMTRPSAILAFLDLAGPAWSPALLLVMAAGVGVFAVAYRLVARRGRTIFDEPLQIPPKGKIDRRLVVGAVVFGLGWGLGGLCPGPALVGAAALLPEALSFVLAMIAGQLACASWIRRRDTATLEKGVAHASKSVL